MNEEPRPVLAVRTLPLHTQHLVLGARFDPYGGYQVPHDYGNPRGEYHHVRERVGISDLSYRSKLIIAGTDRLEFLQGMVSNDVNLPAGAGTYACFLNAKGHLIADMMILQRGDDYLLELAPQAGPDVRSQLEFYVIASDVSIADVSSHYALLALNGPRSRDALSDACGGSVPDLALYGTWPAPLGAGETLVVRVDAYGEEGYEVWLGPGTAAAMWAGLLRAVQALQGGPVGFLALETLRIEAGMARLGADLDATTIPQEAGLDRTAVSFSKGCYVGQETVARVDARGSNVYRRLRGLRLHGTVVPRPGDAVMAATREVGELTSVTYSPGLDQVIALAYVHRGYNDVGTSLQVCHGDQLLRADVVELPFVRGAAP